MVMFINKESYEYLNYSALDMKPGEVSEPVDEQISRDQCLQ